MIAAWYIVFVFLLFYALSSIDRGIISMMVEPLERDLHVRDFQLSLLLGPAFGLFYVLCGLPMGWLIDRFSRRWVVVIGVTAWGLATSFCGLAASFAQLAVARMGVGVGESALTPAAHAMITDRFPPRSLSMALSVYTLGIVIGGAIAVAAGGFVVNQVTHIPPVDLPLVGHVRAWQLVFLACGVATIALTPLALTLRDRRAERPGAASAGAAAALMPLLRRHWMLFIGLPVGWGLMNVMVSAIGGWGPTYLIRTYGWNTAQVGAALGLQGLATGLLGQLGGAAVVDWFYARGVTDAHVRYQMVSQIISVPLFIVGLHVGGAVGYIVFSSAFFALTYPCIGYGAAALQLHTPSHLRGQISALFIAIVTLVGVALGATTTAALTDFVFHDRAMLGRSLTIVCLIYSPLSVGLLWFVARKVRSMHAEQAAAAPSQARGAALGLMDRA